MVKFEGMISGITFRNDENGFTVATLRTEDSPVPLTVVGTMPFLETGEYVELEGDLTDHREYGRQFKVRSYTIKRPEDASSIEKFLGSGLIRGIGAPLAHTIVRVFGDRTLEILDSQPQRLLEVPGIGKKKLAMIMESYQERSASRMTIMFLQTLGLSPNMATKVCAEYGDRVESVIRANPYQLAKDIEGIGFQTADDIASRMGFPKDAPERLRAGVVYVLDEAVSREGHTYMPEAQLLKSAVEILGADAEVVTNIVHEMILRDALTVCELPRGEETERAVYLPALFQAETGVAGRLRRLMRFRGRGMTEENDADFSIRDYEKSNDVQFADEQWTAIRTAVTGKVTVITGGPGTGKTTSIRCILSILEKQGKVELCAPTGRAAKRMSESTGRPARTIHRMLEYGGEDGSFQRNEEKPVEADSVIVDEVSMVDVFLMNALLRALPDSCQLILVGDADQLPSVGAGNVLRDVIASGVVPVIALTQIFRQAESSRIIVNAHRINHGEYPLIQNRDTDFFLERKNSADEAAASVIALVSTRLPGYLDVDPLRGIQVMAPMKKGTLGVINLNYILQSALNPPSGAKGEIRHGEEGVLRLGDKVMQSANNYELEWYRGQEKGEGVFNGDIGRIIMLDEEDHSATVEFDDGRTADYTAKDLNDLELAYCISVHKSQGSEFDAVVLPLIFGPQQLMVRNLLYTAVTRARRLVVIVGTENCIQKMVDNNRIEKRYSALDYWLNQEALEGLQWRK